MKSRVTQAAIAQRAGVHRATVSLSLRNSPAIPPETRQRIQALAGEMGYQPDPVLQALMSYRSGRRTDRKTAKLAYVTNWNTRWGWRSALAHQQFFDGAARRARELGYALEHFWLGERGQTHQRLSDILYHRGIEGVLLASCLMNRDLSVALDWERFSAVRIDCCPRQPALHSITNNQRGIIQLAVRQVQAAGYGRVGFVLPPTWDEMVDFGWSAGFLTEQSRMKPDDRVPLFYSSRTDLPGDDSAPVLKSDPQNPTLAEWFDRYRPEVIIGHSPLTRPPLERLGLKVPGDVAFADIFVETPDGLTAGVRQNAEQVGEVAVDLLSYHLYQHQRGIPKVPTATLIEGTWVEGESLPWRAEAFGSRPGKSGVRVVA